MKFGMRVREDESVVFLHRITDYTDPSGYSLHVIRLTKDVSKAFEFIKLNYEEYKAKQFKHIFDFVDYIITNCPYVTVEMVQSIEKEIRSVTERTELVNQMDKFVKTLKISHAVLRDFDYAPIMLYYNLRERIVRNFFNDDDVDNQFILLKLRYQRNTELINKFSGKKLVTWLAPLKNNSTLAGVFSETFVNYVTVGEPKHFPRYLIDNEPIVIKKEVISFYYNQFLNSEPYRKYCLEGIKNEVKNA